MSKSNQQYIADQLNISRATVSRCFTNHAGINPKTRAKVFELASEIGYIHREAKAGKKPANSSVETLGVLICTDMIDFEKQDYEKPASRIIEGISEYGQMNNYNLEVYTIDANADSIDDPSFRKINLNSKRHWRGILLVYPFKDNVIEQLSKKFSVVSLVEQSSQSRLSSVDVDHYLGISLMMDQLLSNNHKEIGFLTYQYPVSASWSLKRYAAYIEKICREKLSFHPDRIISIDPNCTESQEVGYAKILNHIKDGVTGWICSADNEAYDLMQYLEHNGYNVPDDISITGFDGLRKPEGFKQLTTYDIPFLRIGHSGCRLLSQVIKNPYNPSERILLSGQVIEGHTVASV